LIEKLERPEGESRKLQLTGGSTYTISLPKRWIVQNQLKKNSELHVRSEADGSLRVLPPGLTQHEKTQEAFIHASSEDSPGPLIRKTIAAYLVGYNLVHIRARDKNQLTTRQRSALKTSARNLLVGTEIVTDTASELTLQVLLDYSELSVQSTLRRMAIITSSMHRDAISALGKLDHQMARAIIDTDSEVDRFNLYIIRLLKLAVSNPLIIKEIGLTHARDCLGYRLITKSVERTADHATNIAENILLLKEKLSEQVLEGIEKMSSLAISMFDESIDALFKQDFNMAESIIEKAEDVAKLEKEAVTASQKVGIEEIANLRLLIESVRRTAEYASDIAEIVLNLNIESVLS
jgi:phosphate uptake regulator